MRAGAVSVAWKVALSGKSRVTLFSETSSPPCAWTKGGRKNNHSSAKAKKAGRILMGISSTGNLVLVPALQLLERRLEIRQVGGIEGNDSL